MVKSKWIIAIVAVIMLIGIMLPVSAQSSDLLWVNSSQNAIGVSGWENFSQLLGTSEYQIIGQSGQPYWRAVVVQMPETVTDAKSYYFQGMPAFGFYAGPGQRYVVYIQPVSEKVETNSESLSITPAQPSKPSGKKPNSLW